MWKAKTSRGNVIKYYNIYLNGSLNVATRKLYVYLKFFEISMSYSNFLNLFDSGLSSSTKLCFNFFSSRGDLEDFKRKYERCEI